MSENYAELVKRLRMHEIIKRDPNGALMTVVHPDCAAAADAIEKLVRQRDSLHDGLTLLMAFEGSDE